MKKDSFFWGKVIKTHGLKGEISIRIEADNPQDYASLSMLFIERQKKLIPYFIQKMRLQGDKAHIKLQDIETVEEAAPLCGKNIFLPIELLPKLKGTKFYYHEITDFKVIDQTFGLVGNINTVLEYPNQAIIQISHQGKEVLIPITDEIIKKVDRRSKTMHIQAPEGLIELYLNDNL